jgi:hypothetical protein
MRTIAVVIVLLAFTSNYSYASQTSSYQCARGVVSLGDTIEEVSEKCGAPTSKGYTQVSPNEGSSSYRARHTYTVSAGWTYDTGPNDFVYVLEFKGGKVSSIVNTDTYGRKK